jgi:hypothetical protein
MELPSQLLAMPIIQLYLIAVMYLTQQGSTHSLHTGVHATIVFVPSKAAL